MQKPTSFIVLSMIWCLIGLSGVLVGAGYLIKGSSLLGLTMGFLTLVQGVAAISAGIGLWQLTDWAHKAFIIWAVVCVTRFIFMRVFIYPVPFLRIALVVGVVTVIFFVIYKYTYQKHKNVFYIVDIEKVGKQP